MSIQRRLFLQYTVLLCVTAAGILLGSWHPIGPLPAAQAVRHLYSITWLFSGNTAITLIILLCSAFTGGAVGLIVLFSNAFLYGTVLAIYSQSFWSAIFPCLEMIALMIAIQVGTDIFWSLLLKWRIHLKLTVLSGLASLFLLGLAALIEGGILHV